MSNFNEYDLIQNPAVAATIIWAFVIEYTRASSQKSGPTLPQALPVLPICFHEESVKQFHNRNFKGGLFRALADGATLPAGLQYRVERMLAQTLNAIYVCVAADLVRYDSQTAVLQPVRRTLPIGLDDVGNKEAIATARRLGSWFASLSMEQICIALQVRF